MKKYCLFTLIFTLLTAVACPPPPPVVPENPTDTDGTEIVYRFEPNGGSGSAFNYTVRFAEEFTFPENPFKRETAGRWTKTICLLINFFNREKRKLFIPRVLILITQSGSAAA